MRIRTLWVLLGLTGGLVAAFAVMGVAALLAFVAFLAVPASYLQGPLVGWMFGTGGALIVVATVGTWAGAIWLCVRRGRASETRIDGVAKDRARGERWMLSLAILISTAAVVAFAFLSIVIGISAKHETRQFRSHVASDSTGGPS